jgi:hypothetical protein
MKRIWKMPHAAGHGKKQAGWIYCNTVKPLILSLVYCHRKSDFDRKLDSTQFERNGRI